MNIKRFAKLFVPGAVAAALLALTACGNAVPTVAVQLPRPSYLQEAETTGGSAVVSSSAPEETETNAVQSTGATGTGTTAAPVTTTQAPSQDNNGGTTSTLTPVTSTTQPSATTTTQPTSTIPKEKIAMPVGKAELASFYNNLTKKVNSSKAGFRKVVTTTVSDVTGFEQISAAVRAVAEKPIMSKVDEFMGTGTHPYTASKGQSTNYLVSASLGEDDLVSASCKESGDNYVLTLKVKGVNNPERAANNPLGRYTADFKTAAEGKATFEAGMKITLITVKPTVESVNIYVGESTIVATVNKYTGLPVEIRHTMSGVAELNNIYSKAVGIEFEVDKASGRNNTEVVFNSFEF
ncbi:MAG: hypothetical protein LBQ80_05370 [Clostridium sp.]|jgi:hypothetical protein|nr:hypothetical protein [Clostridium sp.]